MSETSRSDTRSLRLLAALRQSKHRKGHTPDTSPELQREHIDAWAKAKGHRVIGESLDLDVSGRKVAAWNRPDLGAWLRDRLAEFDGVVADSLDRAGRDVEAFLGFQSKYLAPFGKSLHFVAPDIDLSTPDGQMIATNLMAVAQFQSDQLAAKMRDVNAKVRSKGQFAGGDVPFGYRAVKLATPGWGYAVDPLDGWIVRKMADLYLGGKSMRAVVMWLNRCGITSPRGIGWSAESARHLLTTPAIAGIATKADDPELDGNGQPVPKARKYEPLLNASGEMVTFADPGIVSVAEWTRLRQLRKENGHNGPRSNGSLLLHVARCGNCGQWLCSAPQTQRGHTYRYLKCATKIRLKIPGECSNPVIRAEYVEGALDQVIMRELGGVRMRVRHVTPADDKGRELGFVETQIAGLAEALISGKMTPELAGKAERGLMDRREKLIKEAHPEIIEWEVTDATFGEHWQGLDAAGRHDFLVANKITATVQVQGKGTTANPKVFVREREGEAAISVEAGRHVVHVRLGELEPLRRKAGDDAERGQPLTHR